MARERRLDKNVDYEKSIVTVKVISNGATLVCDATKLPQAIKDKLLPLAVSHRIGDAAAGLDGDEAFASMQKVWDGLMAGNFTIRAAAQPKGLPVADIKSKLAALSGSEAKAAAALLEKLGLGSILGTPAAPAAK